MPIKIQSELPAKEILEYENIFVMDENRASHQDIRPLQVCILNLMPVKQDTELPPGVMQESVDCPSMTSANYVDISIMRNP